LFDKYLSKPEYLQQSFFFKGLTSFILELFIWCGTKINQ